MKMERVSEVFVVLEDQPGSIGGLCRVLKKKGINILAIGVFYDAARLHVDDTAKAVEVLQENDFQTEKRDVLRVTMPNKPGMLLQLTEKLGKAGINIKYLYSTLSQEQASGTVILEVDKMQLAVDIFREYGSDV
jgi:hypothetical protein